MRLGEQSEGTLGGEFDAARRHGVFDGVRFPLDQAAIPATMSIYSANLMLDDSTVAGNSTLGNFAAGGAIFGEMGVITNQPRSATVIARGDLKVLKIPKGAVLKILEDYPKVRELVAKIGVARTEDTMEKMLQD